MQSTTLAETMFKDVFETTQDSNLQQMYETINYLKQNDFGLFRTLISTPFIKKQFEMIENEYEFRGALHNLKQLN